MAKQSRLQVRASVEWLAAVGKAAEAMGQPLGSYVRDAVERQVKADGFDIPPDPDARANNLGVMTYRGGKRPKDKA